ncbi:MAG: hypothetical protein JST11_29130 [Acidobacteria bacterium]|nr:hypothetical protein [Acidobacteriota bacterium]
MSVEPFLNASCRISQLLSRRSMLRAALAPLLVPRAHGGEAAPPPGAASVLLPLEGVDPGPHCLSISPDGKTGYVPFGSTDVVLVVDLERGEIRSAIDMSEAGVMLASHQSVLSADGKLLFVVNHGTANVTVIDTEQQRVRQVLPLNAYYGDCLKASPQGKVYIGVSSGLAIVDCKDLSYRILPLNGPVPTSIALSPTRANLLYCVGYPGQQCVLSAINLDDGAVEKQATLPREAGDMNGNIHALHVDPSGAVAYLGWNAPVDSGGFGNLTAFDLAAFRHIVTTSIPDGVSDLAVHPETGKVYAVGSWEDGNEGRVQDQLYLVEWDPAVRAISRRLPMKPAKVLTTVRFDPVNPRFVYIVDDGMSNLLRKVDVLTGAEVMRVLFFPGRRRPNAITSAGSRAYIACQQSPAIQVLDLNSGKLVGSLTPPGRSGAGGCQYYDGKLYLLGGAGIEVIDPNTGVSLLRRQLPDGLSWPPRVTFFRDRIAATANLPGKNPDRVLVVDARTLDFVASFPLETALVNGGGVKASPDGSKLYVQFGTPDWAVIQVLDSSTLRVLNRIEIPAAPFTGGAGGNRAGFDEQNRIAYLDGFCSIYKVHLDTNQFLGMINNYDLYKEMGRARSWATSAMAGIDFNAAKDKLLVTSWDGHSVFFYDLRTQRWIPRVTRVGINPAGTAVSPDGKYLYTVNYLSDTIARVDTESGALLELTPLGGPVAGVGTSNLLHGAIFQTTPVIPGAVMAFKERGVPGEIGPPILTSLRLDAAGRVATETGSTQVLFDGVPAPMLYAYASQVGFVVPFSVAGKKKVTVQLVRNGEGMVPFDQNVADAYPGIFTMDSSGQGQAALLNQDGTLNGPATPAARGSVVVFYATGAGQTDPAGVDGEIAKDVLTRPKSPVTVWVQGQEAEVLYAGAAPGIVSGVLQVNVKVPSNVAPGPRAPIAMRVGNSPISPDGVTLSIA